MSKQTGWGFRFITHFKNNLFQNHFKKKLDSVEKKLTERNGPNLLWMEEFEDDSEIVMPSHDLSTGLPTWSRTLNDFTAGLAVLASQPNHGKSTVLISLMVGLLNLNDDVIVVDLSFDDPEEKRYTQLICCLSGLTYQRVSSLGGLTEQERDRYENARDQIKEWIDLEKYWPFSGGEDFQFDKSISVTVQDQSQIENLMEDIRKQYPTKKIVFFIDAYNDIESRNTDDYIGMDKSIISLKKCAIANEIMCFMAAHVRKPDSRSHKRGRLNLDDIKGSKGLEFASIWAAVLINEWKQNALALPLTIERGGITYPVIAIEPQKSKVSGWTRTMFYLLDEYRCRILPLRRDEFRVVDANYNRMDRE